jgi:hypothetical protein
MNLKRLAVLFAAALALSAVVYGQAPANPELAGALAKELGSTPAQAEGAAGALFGLAKTRMKPEDWSQVAGAVPGMDGLLKAAPTGAVGTTGASAALGGTSAALPGASGLGGLSSAAGAFTKLGLKPEMVMKAVPILTSYVTKSGGAGVGQLLAAALK